MMGLVSPVLLTAVLEALVKSIALLSVALVLTWLLRRSSAAFRHLLLSSGVVSVLILPVASAVLPSWSIVPVPRLLFAADGGNPVLRSEMPVPNDTASQGTHATPERKASETDLAPAGPVARVGSDSRSPETGSPAGESSDGVQWLNWFLIVWGAGASILFLRLLGGKLYGHHVVRAAPAVGDDSLLDRVRVVSKQFGIARRVPVVESDRLQVPFVCGLLRSRLVIPPNASGWSSERLEAVLRHELAHIKRMDILVQFFAQVACCIYWMNPLIWIVERKLFIERERACDDMVINRNIKASKYAEHLMEIMEEMGNTRSQAWVVSAMAEGTDFKDRIISVLDPVARRNSPKRRQLATAMALCTLLILPLSVLHPSSQAGANSDASLGRAATEGRSARADEGGPDDREVTRERRAVDAGDEQLDAFIALLDNPSPDVREHAAEALGAAGSPRAVPALIRSLGDRSASVREHVAEALGYIGDGSAILPLIDVVRSDGNASVREHAVSALGMLGDNDDSYRMLVDLYESDRDVSVRAHAAYALGLMRAQRAFDLLADGLLSRHTVIRRHCADALGWLGDPRALGPLQNALDDHNSGVREAAAQALRRIRRNS